MNTAELEREYKDLEQRVSRIESCLREETERRRQFRRDTENLGRHIYPKHIPNTSKEIEVVGTD